MRVNDLVCGMALDPEQAVARTEFEGHVYYFCTVECQRLFQEDPRRFIDPDEVFDGDATNEQGEFAPEERPEARPCLVAGHGARALPAARVVGQITLEEFEAIVRAEWRHRLGRRSYGRHHPRELIRALLLDALEPGNEAHACALQERLTAEIARLRVAGLTRVQVQRELYHLSHVVGDVLRKAGVPLREATRLTALMDQRLVERLEWQDRWTRIQDAWVVPG